jgi:hypothetical protein
MIQHLDGMAKCHFHGTLSRVYGSEGNTGGLPLHRSSSQYSATLTIREGHPVSFRPQDEGDQPHTPLHILFKESADELGWPDTVLHQLYYNGLPNCIKDLWARSDPPPEL